MASTTTNMATAPRKGFWARFLDALERSVERSARVQSRRARIEALEAKSDDELARLGIRRDDIAYHVFKDLFYA
jgi:uncharacterized protein YjiS (DUF1127 family)